MLKNHKRSILVKIVISLFIFIITAKVIFNFFIKDSVFYTTVIMSKEEKLKNKPIIYNLGVNFDRFNLSTGKAGEFVFTKEKGFDNRLFLEFGYLVKNDRVEKILPSLTYFLPQGIKIIAVSSGKVVELRSQQQTNDYELSVQPSDAPGWRITYDHLQNVLLKKGDTINTADIVGESGDYTMTEINVFIEGTKPEDIENYCPYMLLDDSVKDMYGQKIIQFVKDWEEYTGNTEMYDEESWVSPGCRYEKLNEADLLK